MPTNWVCYPLYPQPTQTYPQVTWSSGSASGSSVNWGTNG